MVFIVNDCGLIPYCWTSALGVCRRSLRPEMLGLLQETVSGRELSACFTMRMVDPKSSCHWIDGTVGKWFSSQWLQQPAAILTNHWQLPIHSASFSFVWSLYYQIWSIVFFWLHSTQGHVIHWKSKTSTAVSAKTCGAVELIRSPCSWHGELQGTQELQRRCLGMPLGMPRGSRVSKSCGMQWIARRGDDIAMPSVWNW